MKIQNQQTNNLNLLVNAHSDIEDLLMNTLKNVSDETLISLSDKSYNIMRQLVFDIQKNGVEK